MTPRFWRSLRIALSRNMAFTAAGAADPRLRGRTYAIPFEEVWQASLNLVGGGLRGWELREADDREGIIRGIAGGRFDRFDSAVTVRVSLDADAQTRVDAMSASRVGRVDLGANARRLDRFFRELDAMLGEPRGGRIEALLVEPATLAHFGRVREAGGV